MARIALGALTTLNLSTQLDPMFADLYSLRELVSDAGYTGSAPVVLFTGSSFHVNMTSPIWGARFESDGGSTKDAIFGRTTTTSAYPFIAHSNPTSGNNPFMGFYTEGTATLRGSITYNRGGGLVAYNTTSDYRDKTEIGPVVDSGTIIDSMRPIIGLMHGATVQRPMFIAHELQVVAAWAVTGDKDAEDDKGQPILQQVDHSSLVPLLVAEIQSLRARLHAAGL